jgi:DNA-binding MurR/RpiR family transcriptional regulator
MASPTFDARIAAHFQRMSPAERRASRGSFGKIESRSSAALASKEETSDARRSTAPDHFEKAVGSIVGAQRILVFGLGPSSAMATYLVIRLCHTNGGSALSDW